MQKNSKCNVNSSLIRIFKKQGWEGWWSQGLQTCLWSQTWYPNLLGEAGQLLLSEFTWDE